MGYTLIIGELKTEIYQDGLYSTIENRAMLNREDKAPAFEEPTDYENQRWPSYSTWAESMRFFGLYDLMFNEGHGLLRSHPGCVPITQEHKEIIDKKYEEFYKKYPNCKPGYSPNVGDESWPKENNYATRLEWLKFWVDYSLENCKIPVFYNS